MEKTSRVRISILDLQKKYEAGDKKPLEDLMRAWKGIKELDHNDERSFFKLGGFHGLPFHGAGWSNAAFWGGYCHHGNVLFPTWHRAYLFKLEEALRSIPGCENVTLPYWDETDEYSRNYGIPSALTNEKFELDGKWIDNPLRSFVLPVSIFDTTAPSEDADPTALNYSKKKGYETVRYPLSGVVGTKTLQAVTDEHNAKYPNYTENVQYLNENIKAWINQTVFQEGRKSGLVEKEYRTCLHAPNYTVFSNTTSSTQWNMENEGSQKQVSLESPHNHIHLAVGGFTDPSLSEEKRKANPDLYHPIEGANGDMGENDTAAFDPIFYFHHCNIDRMFWVWQKIHNKRDELDLIPEYPGTNTSDDQGPTPGMAPNQWLTLETPLEPFKKKEADGKERYFVSNDVVNIEKQLGYTYSIGSLDPEGTLQALGAAPRKENSTKVLVSNLNKNQISGSFVISAFLKNDKGEEIFLGAHSVLSRRNLKYCKNCQNKFEVKAFFDAPDDIDLPKCKTRVHIMTHDEKPADLTHEQTGELLLYSGTQAENRFKNVKVSFV